MTEFFLALIEIAVIALIVAFVFAAFTYRPPLSSRLFDS
jgi:hypothetical protein